MKIQAYKEKHMVNGVTVCEVGMFDASLEEIGRQKLLSLGNLSLYGQSGPSDDDDEKPPSWSVPSRFGIRGQDIATEELDGCLLYASVADLVTFLEQIYVPLGHTRIDGIVSALQSGVSSARARLEERLFKDSVNAKRTFRLTSGHARYAGEAGLAIAERQHFLESESAVYYRDGQTWYVPTSYHRAGGFAWLPTSFRLRGFDLPRLALLVPTDDFSVSQRKEHDLSFMYFNGNRVQWHARISQLRSAELAGFEADGVLATRADFSPFPLSHLNPRGLVRIPATTLVDELVNSDSRIRKPRHRWLQSPGFVVDSREPIALHKGLPVLDDAEVAVFVLQHLANGIYLPDEPASAPQLDARAEGERYVVICDPAVLA